jgi:RNA polymerase sigma-70 factor (ECF subfamily)
MSIQAGLTAMPVNLAAIVADQARFRVWYQQSLPRVYQYLLARCGHDVELAEELTQQTFVEAIGQRNRFDGRSDVITWLCAIGRHKLLDHYRRSGRDQQRHLRMVADLTDGGSDAWANNELRTGVEAGLAQLTGEQRIVLVLRYLDQLPVRDIASSIGRSEKATESLLSRAREAFRGAYQGAVN